MTEYALKTIEQPVSHSGCPQSTEPANDNSAVTEVSSSHAANGGIFRDAPCCRIYRPARSPMQSGRRDQGWLLEFEPSRPRWIEPLMGWTATNDPFAQIRMRFPTKEAAVSYAEREGLDYRVIKPPKRRKDGRCKEKPALHCFVNTATPVRSNSEKRKEKYDA